MILNISNLPESEQRDLLKLMDAIDHAKEREAAQTDFLSFVKKMWPDFIEGRHHQIMADAFNRIARGELKRLIINMPPRHTKSEFASYLLPAFYLGLYPNRKIIQTSHTAELSVDFGRKVRNLVATDEYQDVFSDTQLAYDSKAAGRWNTSKGGVYYAIGVHGAVTGRGADIFIIDDPVDEQTAALGEYNPEVYDRIFEWYTSGPRQRLQPGGAIVLVMCMTGDTDVLLPDGNSRKLRDVRPGDRVATYEDGRVTTSVVNNWRSSGVDRVLKVTTQSGRTLRANERHPFLVSDNGVERWIELQNLRPGMELVSLMGVSGTQKAKLEGYVGPVSPESTTTRKTQTPPTSQLAHTVGGRALIALLMGAVNLYQPRASAGAATIGSTHVPLLSKPPSRIGRVGSSIAMASRLRSTMRWWQSVKANVIFATNCQMTATLAPIGMGSCALTTVTTRERFADYSATTATSWLDTAKTPRPSVEPLSTYSVILDEIVSIAPDGVEEVFDVEIDRTENFIANGAVSHNTRWHKRDMTGRLVDMQTMNDGTSEWEVIQLPAIMPSGKALWPEFWALDELTKIKQDLPVTKWQAQYQQDPTSEEGAIVKRDWWQRWAGKEPPKCEFIIQSWDTAFLKTERSDYSACTTWGVFYKHTEDGKETPYVILLDAYKEKLEFPELKVMAQKKWMQYEPDAFIVEQKASGAPLIFELRALGIPVEEFVPSRGNDKISRLNAVSDLFKSGFVWAPETKWADEVITEVAEFPAGANDDLVDSTTQALLRFRRGGFIRLDSDYRDEEKMYRRRANYY